MGRGLLERQTAATTTQNVSLLQLHDPPASLSPGSWIIQTHVLDYSLNCLPFVIAFQFHSIGDLSGTLV